LIIVSYNSRRYLRPCLESICNYTGAVRDYQIWIVDNASTDGSVSLIKTLPSINRILNQTNRGYGSACNQGIKSGQGKYIFIMNSDLQVTNNWLTPLIQTLKDPKVAIVGPRLINPTGYLVGIPVVKGTFIEQPQSCLALGGACLGIKRALIPELGYFDEHYFHYFEETDYCYQARAHGYRLIYQPTSTIIHQVHGSCHNLYQLRHYYEQSKAYFQQKWMQMIQEDFHNHPDL